MTKRSERTIRDIQFIDPDLAGEGGEDDVVGGIGVLVAVEVDRPVVVGVFEATLAFWT